MKTKIRHLGSSNQHRLEFLDNPYQPLVPHHIVFLFSSFSFFRLFSRFLRISMGEIDTKPIESVQTAISLFGEKNDQGRNKSVNKDELEKEDLDSILKDFANMKVQLEAKDSAHKQTLLQHEHYQKTVDELSTLLKSSELEKYIYINECKEAKVRVSELESRIKDMDNQLAEFLTEREQLSLILSELRVTEGEFLILEAEIAAEKDTEIESMKQAEEAETALSITEEILRHVLEHNETIMHLKLAAVKAQKEKDFIVSAKEIERQLAEVAATEAQEQLQSFMKRLEMMRSLENQILDKSVYIEALQKELRKANELRSSSEKVAFDAILELNQLKADLELKERKNSDQASFINLLEAEVQELKLELSIANQEMNSLTGHVEEMKKELEKAKREVIESRKKETEEVEAEIALLKFELHQGRSRIAAAAADEERAKSEKSSAYIAPQQQALEAEEAETGNQQLKAYETIANESESYFTPHLRPEDLTQSSEAPCGDSKTDCEDEENYEIDEEVRLPTEEYEVLVKMAKKADELMSGFEHRTESENLKKELEIATSKVAQFRTRAEQAISRAEVAEKAKVELEEQIKKCEEQIKKREEQIKQWEEQVKKWKEHRARRKAELAASQEQLISKEITSFRYSGGPPKVYQPLGKVLNMKF